VTGTIEFLARNKKTILECSGLTGVATLNLASTFESDHEDTTYTIERENGFTISLNLIADGAYAVTLGTGFGVLPASVPSVSGTITYEFVYIDGLFELITH
jgi:predicted O-methyltransferase YrrM